MNKFRAQPAQIAERQLTGAVLMADIAAVSASVKVGKIRGRIIEGSDDRRFGNPFGCGATLLPEEKTQLCTIMFLYMTQMTG